MSKNFISGIVYAAGFVAKAHGEDTIARDLLSSAGIDSLKELKASGAEPYDIARAATVFDEVSA